MKAQSKVKILFIDLIIAIIAILLDQFTKYMATINLAGKGDYIIIPGVLQFNYLQNTGAAFSILTNQMTLFYILTPICCALIIYLLIKMPMTKLGLIINFVLTFIFAGAIGNFIDRVVNSYVTDFIYFSLINFPVFNVADIYVTCGVILLFIILIFYVDDDKFNSFLTSLRGGNRGRD